MYAQDKLPYNEYIEGLIRLKVQDPEAFRRLVDSVGVQAAGTEPELDHGRPAVVDPSWATRHIVRWEGTFILGPATLEAKPVNARAKLHVHVRDLQRECSLTNAAVQHMIEICGRERFDEASGTISLVCEDSTDREFNRRECLRALYRLIEEGHKTHPNPNGATLTNPAAWNEVLEAQRSLERERDLQDVLSRMSPEEVGRIERAVGAGQPDEAREALGLTGGPLDMLRLPRRVLRWRAESIAALSRYLESTRDAGGSSPGQDGVGVRRARALKDLISALTLEYLDLPGPSAVGGVTVRSATPSPSPKKAPARK